jgi:2-dehydro-3-deoxyphosphooctonate aldolase (KDO 8-P synthase)
MSANPSPAASLNLQSDLFFVIAGPCVIESAELCLAVAQRMKAACARLGLPYVFKASFDKANRSSGASFRGPGLVDGLFVLERIKAELGVPVLTDVHEPEQATEAAKIVDILQVPAFLARQTDLLEAVGRTNKPANVKKGQFMSPQEMRHAVAKIVGARHGTCNEPILLTERGTFFGYNRLVNDFTGLAVMAETGLPVVFDVTHSTQQPAGQGTHSGGNPQYSPLLARAAMATGVVGGLFLECHPDPRNAKSDAATMLGIDDAEKLLEDCVRVKRAVAASPV